MARRPGQPTPHGTETRRDATRGQKRPARGALHWVPGNLFEAASDMTRPLPLLSATSAAMATALGRPITPSEFDWLAAVHASAEDYRAALERAPSTCSNAARAVDAVGIGLVGLGAGGERRVASPTANGPSAALIAQALELTLAEGKLCQALLAGLSVTEAAASLRIRVSTARSQLRSVFAKTQTCRQADLIALLALLPTRGGGLT